MEERRGNLRQIELWHFLGKRYTRLLRPRHQIWHRNPDVLNKIQELVQLTEFQVHVAGSDCSSKNDKSDFEDDMTTKHIQHQLSEISQRKTGEGDLGQLK